MAAQPIGPEASPESQSPPSQSAGFRMRRLDLNLLVAFDALLHEGGFDPAGAERTFLLGMPDSIEVALLPRLVAHLAAEAPGVRVRVRAIDRFDVLEQLDRDRLHLGVSGLLTE